MERMVAAKRQRPKLMAQDLPRFQHSGTTTEQTAARPTTDVVTAVVSYYSFGGP